MKTSNIILIAVAGAGAFYLVNRMKKTTPEETTRPTTRTRLPQPTDRVDATAQKVKAVRRDAQRVKAIAKKYVNPENVKKALNFIKKVKTTKK